MNSDNYLGEFVNMVSAVALSEEVDVRSKYLFWGFLTKVVTQERAGLHIQSYECNFILKSCGERESSFIALPKLNF